MSNKSPNWKKIEIVLEFLIFGIVIGIAEDLIAITFTTGEPITWKVIGIVILVAIPFAFFGEVVFDRLDFEGFLKRLFGKRKT